MSEKFHYRDLCFDLTRKNIKTLRISINSTGRLSISAPYAVSDSEIARFIEKRYDWIIKKQKESESSLMAQAEQATDSEKRQWRALVEVCVPPLVEVWSEILGVKVSHLVYRNMKSRWGSCQPSTGRVCINTRLALYPPECLEYVVVHELCHFLEPNHGKGFHDLMTRVMPDWKERKSKLDFR